MAISYLSIASLRTKLRELQNRFVNFQRNVNFLVYFLTAVLRRLCEWRFFLHLLSILSVFFVNIKP